MRRYLAHTELRRKKLRDRQSGAALLLFLAILLIALASVAVRTPATSTVLSKENSQTYTALAAAKNALLGRAVADANLPGSLPCPDSHDPTSPYAGTADLLTGNDCPNYVGRLPWRTLGLNDLRDGTGERLWYALSKRFVDDNSSRPLNLGSQGQLSVIGDQPASNVVALVLAPGQVTSHQTRAPVASPLVAADYLEGKNALPGTITFESAPRSSTFNDQLMLITTDDIFRNVVKRIAAEINGSASAGLASYFRLHGLYPWAASQPGGSQSAGLTFGALPAAELSYPNSVLNTNGWLSPQTVQYAVASDQHQARIRFSGLNLEFCFPSGIVCSQ